MVYVFMVFKQPEMIKVFCTAMFCPELLDPLNGEVAYDTIYGAIATYSCDTGYGLSEGDGMQTCGAGGSSAMGTWEGVVPTCEGT